MNIDTGTGVVIVAVLIFYLRLILLQRERAKRLTAPPPSTRGKKKNAAVLPPPRRYSILSQNRRDLWIAGAGLLAILIGALLSLQVLPFSAAHPYWWLPTAVGVVAFSWAFKLS